MPSLALSSMLTTIMRYLVSQGQSTTKAKMRDKSEHTWRSNLQIHWGVRSLVGTQYSHSQVLHMLIISWQFACTGCSQNHPCNKHAFLLLKCFLLLLTGMRTASCWLVPLVSQQLYICQHGAGFAAKGQLDLEEHHIATLVSHTFFVDSHYTERFNPEDNHAAFAELSKWARTCGEIDRNGLSESMAAVNKVSHESYWLAHCWVDQRSLFAWLESVYIECVAGTWRCHQAKACCRREVDAGKSLTLWCIYAFLIGGSAQKESSSLHHTFTSGLQS